MKEINGIETNEDSTLTEKIIGLIVTLAVWGVSLIVMHKMRTKNKKG